MGDLSVLKVVLEMCTSIMLMTMSKNHALSQKVLEDWLRLPERQELFAGLLDSGTPPQAELSLAQLSPSLFSLLPHSAQNWILNPSCALIIDQF